jgi:hypothetical protein
MGIRKDLKQGSKLVEALAVIAITGVPVTLSAIQLPAIIRD